jgi:hypothetical protein
MRTKKISGVMCVHRDDYEKAGVDVVVAHVLVDLRIRKSRRIIGNMRMAGTRRDRLNRKLKWRNAGQLWIPALFGNEKKENASHEAAENAEEKANSSHKGRN